MAFRMPTSSSVVSSLCVKAAFTLFLMSFTSVSGKRKTPSQSKGKLGGGWAKNFLHFFNQPAQFLQHLSSAVGERLSRHTGFFRQLAFRFAVVKQLVDQKTFIVSQLLKRLEQHVQQQLVLDNLVNKRLTGRNLKPRVRKRLERQLLLLANLTALALFPSRTLEGIIYFLADRNLPAI